MEPPTFTALLEPIGFISSCFTEKFGTPRQPGLAPSATARLSLIEPFNRSEMVRGLETFSHVWLQFVFHQAVGDGWKTTVRPPRLDGNERKGVFATRSPHRPNFLGLSAVKLDGIDCTDGVVLRLSGVDLLDGTPVIDIKPYLRYADCLEDGGGGWFSGDFNKLGVSFSDEAAGFCEAYEKTTGHRLSELIREVLQEDPRSAAQREKKSEFGMLLFDVNIRWRVAGSVCRVISCSRKRRKGSL